MPDIPSTKWMKLKDKRTFSFCVGPLDVPSFLNRSNYCLKFWQTTLVYDGNAPLSGEHGAPSVASQIRGAPIHHPASSQKGTGPYRLTVPTSWGRSPHLRRYCHTWSIMTKLTPTSATSEFSTVDGLTLVHESHTLLSLLSIWHAMYTLHYDSHGHLGARKPRSISAHCSTIHKIHSWPNKLPSNAISAKWSRNTHGATLLLSTFRSTSPGAHWQWMWWARFPQIKVIS